MKYPGVVCILLGCLTACNQPSDNGEYKELSDAELNKAKEEVKSTLIAMWDAIEKEDMKRYASYIHPEFTQFGETDSVLLVGKQAEIMGTNSWVSNADNIHTEMLEPRITIRGNVAWIVYYWSDKGLSQGQTFSSKGKATRIFVKEKDRWFCIHGHYTLLTSGK